jgi:hypothetical protein
MFITHDCFSLCVLEKVDLCLLTATIFSNLLLEKVVLPLLLEIVYSRLEIVFMCLLLKIILLYARLEIVFCVYFSILFCCTLDSRLFSCVHLICILLINICEHLPRIKKFFVSIFPRYLKRPALSKKHILIFFTHFFSLMTSVRGTESPIFGRKNSVKLRSSPLYYSIPILQKPNVNTVQYLMQIKSAA